MIQDWLEKTIAQNSLIDFIIFLWHREVVLKNVRLNFFCHVKVGDEVIKLSSN